MGNIKVTIGGIDNLPMSGATLSDIMIAADTLLKTINPNLTLDYSMVDVAFTSDTGISISDPKITDIVYGQYCEVFKAFIKNPMINTVAPDISFTKHIKPEHVSAMYSSMVGNLRVIYSMDINYTTADRLIYCVLDSVYLGLLQDLFRTTVDIIVADYKAAGEYSRLKELSDIVELGLKRITVNSILEYLVDHTTDRNHIATHISNSIAANIIEVDPSASVGDKLKSLLEKANRFDEFSIAIYTKILGEHRDA